MTLPLHEMSIVLVDDHLVVAHGIMRLLKGRARSVQVLDSGAALLTALQDTTPDAILLDIVMPGMSGIETLEALKRLGSKVPVVMLTMHDDASMVRRALAAGAIGYVVKNAVADELVTALEHAVRGIAFVSSGVQPTQVSASIPRPPSAAQLAVLKLVAEGLRPKQIAEEMGISTRTVESHKYMLMQRFEVSTTLALIRRARQEGLI